MKADKGLKADKILDKQGQDVLMTESDEAVHHKPSRFHEPTSFSNNVQFSGVVDFSNVPQVSGLENLLNIETEPQEIKTGDIQSEDLPGSTLDNELD